MAQQSSAPRRVIIDTDPAMGVLGSDPEDATAVIMAMNSPELEVAAVTVVNGNVPLRIGYANARHLLGLLGREETPLAPGPERPLMGSRTVQLAWQEQKAQSPTIVPFADHREVTPRAPQLIAETVLASEQPTTIIAIGPMTNVALALLIEPRIVERVDRVIAMGGTGREPGNITSSAEFNFWCDPEAAAIVLDAGWPITLLTLEICHRVRLRRERLASAPSATPLGAFVKEACAPWLDLLEAQGEDGFPLFDSLTVATAVDAGVIETRPALVTVDVTPGAAAGTSEIRFDTDVLGAPLRATNADVSVGVDEDRFMALYAERILDRL